MNAPLPDPATPPADCPACTKPACAVIETLDIAHQHKHYAEGRPAMQQALDAAWSLPHRQCRMRQCAACGLEFADPLQAPSAAWYARLYGTSDLYPITRWEYGVVMQALAAHDTVLDHGCGSGHFLGLAAPRVRQVIGTDFSPEGVAAVQARGIEAHLVTPGRGLETMRRHCSTPASQVTAFHVLEHLERPSALFDLARTLGTAGVQLWVAVPSNRRASRLHGEADALDAPPHHLTRWTPAALDALGRACGWQLQSLLYEPLPMRLRVWEAGRRSRAVASLAAWPRPLRRVLSRATAAAVWASGQHRMQGASGFSMLARYTQNQEGSPHAQHRLHAV